MSRYSHLGRRNTAGAGLLSPETNTNSQPLGTYQKLRPAVECVRKAIDHRGVRAVGFTTFRHIRSRATGDVRYLTPSYGLDAFVGQFAELYQFHDRFEVRMEELPPAPTAVDQSSVRVAMIVCLEKGQRLEDITDIKEQ